MAEADHRPLQQTVGAARIYCFSVEFRAIAAGAVDQFPAVARPANHGVLGGNVLRRQAQRALRSATDQVLRHQDAATFAAFFAQFSHENTSITAQDASDCESLQATA